MICVKCKAQLADSQKFCPKCGAKAPGQPIPGLLAHVAGKGRDEEPLAAVPRLNQPPALVSGASAASSDQGDVVCPVCGTRNPETAKFCKKDGAPLRGSAPAAAPPRTPPRPPKVWRLQSRSIIVAGGAVLFAIAALTGGALYWTGYIGDRQGAIAQEINAQLGGKGLGNIKVLVDKQWRATAEGVVASSVEKDLALSLIKEHGQLKEPISDQIRVRPTRAALQAILDKVAADSGWSQVSAQIDDSLTTITVGGADFGPEARARLEQAMSSALSAAGTSAQARFVYNAGPAPTDVATPPADGETLARALNEQLQAAGLNGVSAQLDTAGKVRLQGAVSSQEQHDRVIQIASSQAGVAGVVDLLQTAAPQPATENRDPAKLEGEINRLLRNNGLGGVTAQVADDFSLTLKGSATSAGNKNRAFQLARQFPVKGTPRDKVFIVE
jgi:osmotically-inducible protein OsmY/ribosomal protein L40E